MKSAAHAQDPLLATLRDRFARHAQRHRALSWPEVQARLNLRPSALDVLRKMEKSGGEPDVVGLDPRSGEVLFFDCSAESPAGRRRLCYDRQALLERKTHRPVNDAVGLAAEMGISLLTEEQYRHLQTLGEFDTKTSSWVHTPEEIRQRGGALFCDRRYGAVFVYHNGAQSYYGARGFRGALRV